MTDVKRQSTVVEIAVTYISIGWAFVMLTNDRVFEQSQNFERLEFIAQNEWVVGLICLFLAVFKILAIIFKSRRFRWLGLVLSGLFWSAVSATFVLSSETFTFNTGFIAYSAVAILCLWTSKEVILVERTVKRSIRPKD